MVSWMLMLLCKQQCDADKQQECPFHASMPRYGGLVASGRPDQLHSTIAQCIPTPPYHPCPSSMVVPHLHGPNGVSNDLTLASG
jgi:hypothetical protein